MNRKQLTVIAITVSVLLCLALLVVLTTDRRRYIDAVSAYRTQRYSASLDILNSCSQKQRRKPNARYLRNECQLGLANAAIERRDFAAAMEHLSQTSSDYSKHEEVGALRDKCSKTIANEQEKANCRRENERLAEQRAQRQKQSEAIQDSIRTAYFALMKAKDDLPSNNQFIQEERAKEIATATRMFAETISTPFEVDGWTVFANNIYRTDSGETVIWSCIGIYIARDGSPKGVSAIFTVQNDACLQKVKRISTPCMIEVFGRYTGKRRTETFLEENGYYDLQFKLDDVKDRSITGLKE